MSERRVEQVRVVSARPEMTAALMESTGLDEEMLRAVVDSFYTKVRADDLLGPIFDARIRDWGPHLARMTEFWSSVALMTGRYHGSPALAHADLPVTWTHFEQWLALFRQTAEDLCPPEGAAHLIERAERIARSLHMVVENATSRSAPSLRPPAPAGGA